MLSYCNTLWKALVTKLYSKLPKFSLTPEFPKILNMSGWIWGNMHEMIKKKDIYYVSSLIVLALGW